MSDREYSVVINITLVDVLEKRAVMQTIDLLPFAPTRGTEIGWTAADGTCWSALIRTVVWDRAAKQFHVELEDWQDLEADLDEMTEQMGGEWRRLGAVAGRC